MKHFVHTITVCLLWSMLCYGQPSSNGSVGNVVGGCPNLAIQLKAPKGNNTFYAISYCNIGDVTAEDSYLEIELDSDLSIIQATYPLLYKSNNVYRFLIGDVDAGECGSMYFQIPQALIKAHCLDAFAATALPCSNNTSTAQTVHTTNGGSNDNNNPNNGGFALTQAEVDLAPTGIGSSSYSDPIFEDHVFLDFVPTWDSLMRMFNDLQTYTFDPNCSTSVMNSSVMVVPVSQALPEYATASYCRQKAATTDAVVSHHTSVNSANNILSTNNNIDNSALSIVEELPIILAPNPVKGTARLYVDNYEAHQLQLEVFNVQGRRVGYFESNDNCLIIQVDGWSRGIYFYQLSANGKALHSDRFLVE